MMCTIFHIRYECRLLDHAEFALLATLTEASAGCPTNNSFLRLAAEMPSPPDPIEMEKYRTHQITLQGIDVSDVNDLSSVDCGGYHDGVSTNVWYIKRVKSLAWCTSF